MNTILITGTAKAIGSSVKYNVNVWAAKDRDQIELIGTIETTSNYNWLWTIAKSKVISYLGNENKFDDGAYTRYLDHLIVLPATNN